MKIALVITALLSVLSLGTGQIDQTKCENIYSDLLVCYMLNESCGNFCGNVNELGLESNRALTCDEVEEEIGPDMRCCEECWEVTQTYWQCTYIEPLYNLGLIEEGCVMDCSRFPFQADTASPIPPAPVPPAPVPPTPVPPTPFPSTFAPIGPTDNFLNNDDDIIDGDSEECQKKADAFEACVERKCNRAPLTCDTSTAEDPEIGADGNICSIFDPVVCVVEDCCRSCVDEYVDAINCQISSCADYEFECGKGTTSGAPLSLFFGFAAAMSLALTIIHV